MKRNLLFGFAVCLILLVAIIGGCDLSMDKIANPENKIGKVASADFTEEVNELTLPPEDLGISADSINALGRLAMLNSPGANQEVIGSGKGWQLYVPVPFYSQRDPHWSGDKLGNSSTCTIGSHGCHLSCIAMHYAKWGYYNMNPGELNRWARNHGCFPPKSADIIARCAVDYPSNRDVRRITSDQIYGELQKGHPVVIKAWIGTIPHYMIIFAFDGARYWVKDPWRDWTAQDRPLYGSYGGSWVYGY